jgi:predicted N-acetyltransferase YhbS
MKIRYLQEKDLEQVDIFLRSMWISHPKKEPNLIKKSSLESINLKEYFSKSLKRESEFALIAKEKGIVIGVVRVEKVKLEDFFKFKEAYYIDDLAVKSEWKRKKIATKLYNEIVKIAKKNKIKLLKTRIYEFNSIAQKYIKKVGMKRLYSEYFKIIC